jgi:hypothetical protein
MDWSKIATVASVLSLPGSIVLYRLGRYLWAEIDEQTNACRHNLVLVLFHYLGGDYNFGVSGRPHTPGSYNGRLCTGGSAASRSV